MTEDWSDRINVITDPLEIIRCLRSSMIKDLTCNGFHKLAIDAIKKAIDPLTGNNPTKCKLSLNEIGGLNFSDDGNGLNILEGNLEQTTYILTTMLAGEPPKDVQTYSSVNFLFNISPLLIATSAYFSIDTVSENCQYIAVLNDS
jgi:DNA gyrase/topoisomerase IV subunit B